MNSFATSPCIARKSIHTTLMTSVSLLSISLGLGMNMGDAHAQCVTAGTTLNCSGDLSAGITESGDFGPININSLTDNIGGRGALFTSTTNADIVFNADTAPFQILLNPGFSRTVRAGFGAVTDGSVSGTVNADIIGPTVADSSTTNLFDLANFGSFNFLTGTGINLTHNGVIDVSRPTITATSPSQANPFAPGQLRDFVMGQFGAVRLRDDSGDINFTNNGSVSLDGGQRNLNVDQSGNSGVNQRVFSTTFAPTAGQSNSSTHIGIFVEGNGDIDIEQNGDINLSGGGIDASAITTDAIASVTAKHSGGRGVFISDNDFGAVDQVSFTDEANLTINGNIDLRSGQVGVSSTAINSGGNPNAKAVARTDIPTQIGIWLNKPSIRNTLLDGDLTVINDETNISARAINGSGDADGLVYASAQGINASGYESFPFVSGNTETRRQNLNVTGDVLVQGGDINAEIVGTGVAPVNELSSLSTSNPVEAFRINRFGGSGATGISIGGDESAYDVGGSITSVGGNATATVTGSSLTGFVNGGRANSLSYSTDVDFNGNPLDKVETSDLSATGGNVTANLQGTDLQATINGGSATALNITAAATGAARFVQVGDIMARGGDADGTASAGSEIDVGGGGAFGIFATVRSPIFNDNLPNGSITFRNEANVTVRGGDASLTGDGTETGGAAIGFSGQTGTDQDVSRFENAGTIRATSGMGSTRRGVALGIAVSDFGFPTFVGSEIINNSAHILSTGAIFVDGTDIDAPLSFNSNFGSAGIAAGIVGDASILLDGGTIDAQGDFTHGIASSSLIAEVVVDNSASVTVAGLGGAGIAFGAAAPDFFTGELIPSKNMVFISQDSSVMSTNGIGIFDDGRAMAENETTVDIAGTLGSGTGIAIDLGDGSDTIILRQTANITGVSNLGSGDDFFNYQGFTENNPIDGGDDRDRIAVDVNAGDTNRFDPNTEVPNLTNFEVIFKGGEGTLTVGGVEFANGPLDFEVNDGLGIIDSDLPSTNVFINDGGHFQTDNRVGDIENAANGLVNGVGSSGNFNNSGTFAPGNSIGTFTVTGDFVQSSTGTLDIEIEAPDQSDLIIVEGTTTLDGALNVTARGMLSAYEAGNQFTIIDSAGDVSGMFATTTDNLPDLDVEAETVDGGDGGEEVQLILVAMDDSSPSADDTTDKSIYPNALQAGAASAGMYTEIVQTRARTLVAGGQSTPTPDSLALGMFDSSSTVDGEAFKTAQKAGGYTNSQEGTFAWLSGYGAARGVDDTTTVTGYDSTIGGIAFGLDSVFVNDDALFTLGISGGYSSADIDSGPSSANVQTWHIGAYGSLEKNNWLLSGVLAYGIQDYDFTRSIGIGSVVANGQADGNVFSASFAASHNIAPLLGMNDAKTRIAPLLRFDHVSAHRNGFTETRAGVFNLTVDQDDFTYNSAGIGVEVSTEIELPNGMIARPNAEIRWDHSFSDNNAVSSSSIASVAGANFTTPGAIEDKNRAVVGAGIEIDVSDKITANFNYDGTFSTSFSSHSGSAGLKIKF